MNNLYNKILNEVYLIQDFDSWDNTESDFKESVVAALSPFIYYFEDSKRRPLRILDDRDDWDPENFSYDWPSDLREYYYKRVYIEGKKAELNDIGRTEEFFKGHTEYHVVIIDLDNKLYDCQFMFYMTDVKMVPMFDTSKSRSMQNMFYGCKSLVHVPALSLDFITKHHKKIDYMADDHPLYCMFGGKQEWGLLDDETISIWYPDLPKDIIRTSGGLPDTPTRLKIEKAITEDIYKKLPF